MALEDTGLTGEVIGAAIRVHRVLGPGFLESVYEKALLIELEESSIRASSQVNVRVQYRGRLVGLHRLDLLIDNRLLVELKAVDALNSRHLIVVRSYLKAIDKEFGLLMNFGCSALDVRRVFAAKIESK